MASVTLEELRKTYDKKSWAVNGISLQIADGELIALLGPSGCGKSSTMRMIAGLEELTSGKIYFNEQLMNRIPPKQRNVAMVFETYALYPTLTVYENLAFPLRSAGWNNEAIKKRVREIVEILQVEHLLSHKPQDLSSGQSQLVGLGRALMRQPNVFVMDEPISHLDTRLRSRMRSYIKRLHIDLGYTMLYVTHDQEEAMALADRIAIMDQGNLKQVGTPHDVFYHPNDLFVAGFVGEPPMNFLKCDVVHDNGSYHLEVHGHHLPVPTDLRAQTQAQSLPEHIIVGIRPFYISIGHHPDQQHTLPASVFVVEPLGDSTVISVDTDDGRLQISLESAPSLKAGDKSWLAFDPDYMVGFDPMTTRALVQHSVDGDELKI